MGGNKKGIKNTGRETVGERLLGKHGRYVMMDLREMVCEAGRWMELAQDSVQWRGFVLAVLNLWVLLPEN
jgi:hypothetical protein